MRWQSLFLMSLVAAHAAWARPDTPDPSKGIVVVGVRLPQAHLARYYVNIVQVAAADGGEISDDEIDMGDGWATNFSGTYDRFEIEELEPGDYQIVNVNYDSGQRHYVVCLSDARSRFTVKAGGAIFLGGFVLRPRQTYVDGLIGPPLERNEGDLAMAQAALAKEYAVADGALTRAELAVAPRIARGECRR